MVLKKSQHKIKGMTRDSAESIFNPEYAFENMNVRLNTTGSNTMLSIQNEQGNTAIEVIDDTTGTPLVLTGTPIGTSTIDENLVIFTTETTYPSLEVVEQEEYNLQNTFRILSFKFLEKDSTSGILRFLCNIEELGNPLILQDLEIRLGISYIMYNNGNYTTSYHEATNTLTTPSGEVLFDYALFSNSSYYIGFVLHRIYVTYPTAGLLYTGTVNTAFSIYDYNKELLGVTQSISYFPTYPSTPPVAGEPMTILDSTAVTEVITKVMPNIETINGDIDIEFRRLDYVLTPEPAIGYSDTINYFTINAYSLSNQGVYSDFNPEDIGDWVFVYNKQAMQIPVESVTSTAGTKESFVGDLQEVIFEIHPANATFDSYLLDGDEGAVDILSSRRIDNKIFVQYKGTQPIEDRILFWITVNGHTFSATKPVNFITPTLIVTPDSTPMTIGYLGTEIQQVVAATTNGDIEFLDKPEWLNIRYDASNIYLSASPNTTAITRTGSFKVKSTAYNSNLEYTVQVEQTGKPQIFDIYFIGASELETGEVIESMSGTVDFETHTSGDNFFPIIQESSNVYKVTITEEDLPDNDRPYIISVDEWTINIRNYITNTTRVITSPNFRITGDGVIESGLNSDIYITLNENNNLRTTIIFKSI